eukprot:3068500-Prymnesium_polylepis.1
MANSGFSLDESRCFATNLEDSLRRINPSALNFLCERPASNFNELKHAIHSMTDANAEQKWLIFNAAAGDHQMVASMKDVVERMAEATGRRISWVGIRDGASPQARVSDDHQTWSIFPFRKTRRKSREPITPRDLRPLPPETSP